jgi:hypothetical protein
LTMVAGRGRLPCPRAMLRRLRIEKPRPHPRGRAPFAPGLNAITGETVRARRSSRRPSASARGQGRCRPTSGRTATRLRRARAGSSRPAAREDELGVASRAEPETRKGSSCTARLRGRTDARLRVGDAGRP